jgi:hypothetical protein
LDTDGTGVMSTSHDAEHALAEDAARAFKASDAHVAIKDQNNWDPYFKNYFKDRPFAHISPKGVDVLTAAGKLSIDIAGLSRGAQASASGQDSGGGRAASGSSITISGGALEKLSAEDIMAWIARAQKNAWHQRVGTPLNKGTEATSPS